MTTVLSEKTAIRLSVGASFSVVIALISAAIWVNNSLHELEDANRKLGDQANTISQLQNTIATQQQNIADLASREMILSCRIDELGRIIRRTVDTIQQLAIISTTASYSSVTVTPERIEPQLEGIRTDLRDSGCE